MKVIIPLDYQPNSALITLAVIAFFAYGFATDCPDTAGYFYCGLGSK